MKVRLSILGVTLKVGAEDGRWQVAVRHGRHLVAELSSRPGQTPGGHGRAFSLGRHVGELATRKQWEAGYTQGWTDKALGNPSAVDGDAGEAVALTDTITAQAAQLAQGAWVVDIADWRTVRGAS